MLFKRGLHVCIYVMHDVLEAHTMQTIPCKDLIHGYCRHDSHCNTFSNKQFIEVVCVQTAATIQEWFMCGSGLCVGVVYVWASWLKIPVSFFFHFFSRAAFT